MEVVSVRVQKAPKSPAIAWRRFIDFSQPGLDGDRLRQTLGDQVLQPTVVMCARLVTGVEGSNCQNLQLRRRGFRDTRTFGSCVAHKRDSDLLFSRLQAMEFYDGISSVCVAKKIT